MTTSTGSAVFRISEPEPEQSASSMTSTTRTVQSVPADQPTTAQELQSSPSLVVEEKSAELPPTKKFKKSLSKANLQGPPAQEGAGGSASRASITGIIGSPSGPTRAVSATAMKESVDMCIQEMSEAARKIHNKWREAFRESEDFEAVALSRVEALLKTARAHKQSLEMEKQALIQRLKGVTSILEKPSFSNPTNTSAEQERKD